ncbi:hypothetical protein BS643_23110 [Pseudomonas protegens]|uniref:DUF4365 domain-containing protein n=1 Tax=Pseudomonas protegens TaxID=380021 RepID=UPI000807073B|nr:DUF4365 domain-containing protein [Pseudomonas protegens]OBZ20253.1 hypothetical protein BBH58_28805 [Pseudomonas protegens]OBZ21356.1 hypothetical protein BBH57_28840 [Pseudomonas protegens]OKK40630.1 hypothetical protein BS643_23110 [Pseudomonas protegens]OKK52776.1 hypothetical protein BS644_02755 [Pseudomonas protegens]OKK58268.1 hypothetical protein BS646_24370 [Pseudomonas protegens]
MSVKRPKRPPSHIIGNLAEAMVEYAFTAKGWVYRRLEKDKDYGIDGEVEIFDSEGSATGVLFKVQIKGSEKNPSNLKIKRSTENYLSISPLSVFLFSVETTTGAIRFCFFDPEGGSIKNYNLDNFIELDAEGFEILKDIASDHCAGCLLLNDYTLHNASAQLIRCLDLLLNFGGDVDSMMKWLRLFAPDDVLAMSYGYAVFLKQQMSEDSGLLEKLRKWVLEFFPEVKEEIDYAMKAFTQGQLIGKRAEIATASSSS